MDGGELGPPIPPFSEMEECLRSGNDHKDIVEQDAGGRVDRVRCNLNVQASEPNCRSESEATVHTPAALGDGVVGFAPVAELSQ